MRLILLLQSRKRTCSELAELLDVSRRTVMRDVEALGRMGVAVASRSGPGGHYEMDGERNLRPLELTGSEALLLSIALDVLGKHADVPYAESRETLAAKVRALLPGAQADRAEGRLETVHIHVPSRSHRAPHLSRLIEHCQKWAEIRYSAEEGEATYLAKIERVYADSGLWYVEALVEGRRRNLRADRVLEIEAAEAPQKSSEPKDYSDPSHPLVRVVLSAKGLRNLERDVHAGHMAKDQEPPATIEFRCPPEELDWYARYFGGMGPDAVVLGPPELVRILVERARRQLEMYGVADSLTRSSQPDLPPPPSYPL